MGKAVTRKTVRKAVAKAKKVRNAESNRESQRKYREAKRKAGYAQVSLWIKRDRVQRVRSYVDRTNKG